MQNLKNTLLTLKSVLTKRNPFYVQLALSKYCNLHCKMCQAVESRQDERELNLDEIEELAQTLLRMGVVFLILTGGEPLLRKDLAEIVNIFTKKKIAVRLQTNGIGISAERINSLIKAGLKDVTVSLESLTPEKQDLITGKSGSWHETIKAISLFSQHLPTKGSFCGVNIVVSKFNLDEIVDLVRFVSKIGFYASLIPVHLSDTSQDYIVRGNNKMFVFNESDYENIDRVYADLISLKQRGCRIYNSYRFLKESPYFLKYKKIFWHCDSPYLYFAISPSGSFLPCVDIKMDEPMLNNGDFVKRYRSKEFRNRVRNLVNKCGGCMYACWPEISYFCGDLSVFIERILEGFKIHKSQRKPIDFEKMLNLTGEFKSSGSFSASG